MAGNGNEAFCLYPTYIIFGVFSRLFQAPRREWDALILEMRILKSKKEVQYGKIHTLEILKSFNFSEPHSPHVSVSFAV